MSDTIQVLEVKEGFSSFGVEYRKGDEVDFKVASSWPGPTLENRLKHGFLGFKTKLMEAIVQAASQGNAKPDFQKMTKEELISYSKEHHGVDLDAKLSVVALREAVAKLEAAEAG